MYLRIFRKYLFRLHHVSFFSLISTFFSAKTSSSNTLALTVDSKGKVQYDAILRQGHGGGGAGKVRTSSSNILKGYISF